MNKTRFTSIVSVGALASCALLSPSNAQAQPSQTQMTNSAFSANALRTKATCDPPRDSGPKARGVRLAVHSYFVVTNSEDGYKDRDVEVFGYLNINGQRTWTVQKKNGITAIPYRRIDAGWYEIDVMFDNSAAWSLKLNGYAKDYDKGSDDDGMWNPKNTTRHANVKALYDKQRLGQHSTLTLPGDRSSENADLVLELGPSKLIY